MAEDRMPPEGGEDDGRKKKFGVVVGEDGEEELVISEEPDGEDESEEDIGVYPDEDDGSESGDEAPEGFVEGEEYAELTPEQVDEAVRRREAEEREKAERMELLKGEAARLISEGAFAESVEYISEAAKTDPSDGQTACLLAVAATRGFEDFSDSAAVRAAADDVAAKASVEDRAAMYARYGAVLERKVKEDHDALEAAIRENDEGKSERREALAPRKKSALTRMCVLFAVFAVFLIATIVFSTFMFSDENGAYIVVTIVLGVIALGFLVAAIVASRYYAVAKRMYDLNERNTSTRAGREMLEIEKRYDTERACLKAVGKD